MAPRNAIQVGTPCVGSCKRALRPASMTLADAPGTIVDAGHGRCLTCKRTGDRNWADKAACKEGHPFSEENTYWNRGNRYCRECSRAAGRRYHARGNGDDDWQMEELIPTVTIRPEIMDAARQKVTRWYPGDHELLRMLGMAA